MRARINRDFDKSFLTYTPKSVYWEGGGEIPNTSKVLSDTLKFNTRLLSSCELYKTTLL